MNRRQQIETMAHLVCEMANKPDSCNECPSRRGGCFTIPKMEKLVDNFIKKECDECAGCTQWKCDCSNIKIEAYEEFANELKCRTHEISCNTLQVVTEYDIDDLLKELKSEIMGESGNENSSI